MMEYEYSFTVKDIKPFLSYCEEHGFCKTIENYQIRELYKNNTNVYARITTEKENDYQTILLDFKEESNQQNILKHVKESFPLLIDDNDFEAIFSMFDILKYKKSNVLNRNRIVYEKKNVKFEIDEYFEPKKCFVVGIEGKRKLVDAIYLDLKECIENVIVK